MSDPAYTPCVPHQDNATEHQTEDKQQYITGLLSALHCLLSMILVITAHITTVYLLEPKFSH